jgi:heat shock protein HspQ
MSKVSFAVGDLVRHESDRYYGLILVWDPVTLCAKVWDLTNPEENKLVWWCLAEKFTVISSSDQSVVDEPM